MGEVLCLSWNNRSRVEWCNALGGQCNAPGMGRTAVFLLVRRRGAEAVL